MNIELYKYVKVVIEIVIFDQRLGIVLTILLILCQVTAQQIKESFFKFLCYILILQLQDL